MQHVGLRNQARGLGSGRLTPERARAAAEGAEPRQGTRGMGSARVLGGWVRADTGKGYGGGGGAEPRRGQPGDRELGSYTKGFGPAATGKGPRRRGGELRTNDETRRQHRRKPGVGKSGPERGVRAPRVGSRGSGALKALKGVGYPGPRGGSGESAGHLIGTPTGGVQKGFGCPEPRGAGGQPGARETQAQTHFSKTDLTASVRQHTAAGSWCQRVCLSVCCCLCCWVLLCWVAVVTTHSTPQLPGSRSPLPAVPQDPLVARPDFCREWSPGRQPPPSSASSSSPSSCPFSRAPFSRHQQAQVETAKLLREAALAKLLQKEPREAARQVLVAWLAQNDRPVHAQACLARCQHPLLSVTATSRKEPSSCQLLV